MRVKQEYLDNIYHIQGRQITLRFLDKGLYDTYSRILPEAFEEEPKIEVKIVDSSETSFEKTELFKKSKKK